MTDDEKTLARGRSLTEESATGSPRSPQPDGSRHTPGPWRALGDAMKVYASDATGEMCICDIRGWGHLLWEAVPWGKTFDLDVKLLNEAPLHAKAVIAKAEGQP